MCLCLNIIIFICVYARQHEPIHTYAHGCRIAINRKLSSMNSATEATAEAIPNIASKKKIKPKKGDP